MKFDLNILRKISRPFFIFLWSFFIIISFQVSDVIAEGKKEAPKGERVIKRKPVEEKKIKGQHSDEVKAPDAIESKTDFPNNSESEIMNQALEAVILLDSSRSMQKTDPKRIRDQGAKLFMQFLEPEDRISIIEFSDTANVLLDLKTMKSITPQDVEGVLESIKNEGNFTNFLAPLESALDILLASESKSSSKVVILLTDGQMDPSSIPEQKEEFIAKLIKEKLPEYSKHHIKVFTLGLSDLADKDLLGEIAKKTEGHAEYAQDVNTIHKVFSNLFLSIKKPQVLELESGGFSIDGNTSEATFFINRQAENDSITVIDPTGKEYINKDFPARWKWFRGDLFDVITVPSPLPGRWGIRGGVGDLSGFAKLLSDLKLEYSLPGQSFSVGDSAIIKVRLTESGKIVDDPNFAGLVFYSYRIVNLKTGQIYLQAQLADKGDRGDEKAGDGVFSETISLNEEGEYKLFLVATAPTLTRQAHIPFSVSAGMISFSHVPRNEFTGDKDRYLVSVHGVARNLSKRVVAIEASVDSEKYQINLEKYKIDENSYQVPLDRLKSGENKVVALLQGLDESKHDVRARSEQLVINVESHLEEAHGQDAEIKIEENVAEAEVHPDEQVVLGEEGVQEGVVEAGESYTLYGIIALVISLVSSGVIGRRFIKKSKIDVGSQVLVRDEYVVPPSLNEQLEVMISKVGNEKREFFSEELALFAVLIEKDPEAIKKLKTDSHSAVSSENTSTSSEEVEEEADGSSSEESSDDAEETEGEEA